MTREGRGVLLYETARGEIKSAGISQPGNETGWIHEHQLTSASCIFTVIFCLFAIGLTVLFLFELIFAIISKGYDHNILIFEIFDLTHRNVEDETRCMGLCLLPAH